jgi:cytochrome c biogenesis protein CcmG, thiol:disulfide interchange protein DsbE
MKLTLFDGGSFTLADQQGKLVFVNFWASWCVPCKAEMPEFDRVYQRYKDRGVVFVGANVQDLEMDARAFLEEVKISYPVGLDPDEEVAIAFGVNGLPTSALVTRDGKLAVKRAGALTQQQLEKLLDEYV